MMQQQLRQTLILLGLPCLCTLLLAILLWNLPHDIHINIGQPTDAAYLEGFHERSLQSAPPFASYRWTTPQAEVILPAVPAPAQVQLQLAAPPGGTTLELVANDQKLGAFTIVPDTLRSYESLWRGSPRGDGTFTLGLHAPASRIGDDERPLGVLVSRITVTPLGWSLPPWLPLVCLLALVMAGWQSARLLGAPALAASLAASLLGMGMALGWGLARLWVAPFLGVAALGAVAVSGTLTLLHWRTAARESLRPADLLALFAVCTTAIPVYLYLRIGWPNPPTFYDILLALLPLGLLALWSEGTTRRVALGGVLAVALVFLGIGLVETFRSDFSRDFLAIYRGVARFVHGTGPLYLLDVIQANPLDATFKYPPTFALLFAPFTWLSFVPAFYSWKVFNLLLLLASCALLLHTYRISWRSGAAAGLLLLACTLAPLIDSLRFGQLDLVLLFLLTLGLHAVRQGHNTWFGALVGLA
nr:DUF2029 domain-containing protein [Chloroflexaceae bacterium]